MTARNLFRCAAAALSMLCVLAVYVRFDLRTYFVEQVLLLIVIIALRWRIGPALVAAVTAVVGDNILLREPVGTPVITGTRDLVDLVLFSTVAVTVAWLVASAQRERVRAEAAAARERAAREDRDRLIALVSHDLAAPITAIRGAVQFARRGRESGQVDLGRLLARVDTAAARATSLIRLLLDAHSLEEGLLRMNVETADLRAVVAPVVDMLDRYSERHLVLLATPPQPVAVQCDVERMSRVVESLVTNAIKYSPEGGRVEISLSVEGSCAALRVRDYGIGIPADSAHRIFDRSFRAQNAIETAPGLGLGLHTSAEIVRRHGGSIEAQPEPEGGTTFLVRLPLHVTAARGARGHTTRTPAETDGSMLRSSLSAHA